LLALGAFAYAVAYRLYSRSISCVFGLDTSHTPPAPVHVQCDGGDYVPAHKFVLFDHDFASIADAGPIIGPILAAYFGWRWPCFRCCAHDGPITG